MGGFSISHPETKDAPELLYDLLHNYQHSVGELKQGGKLNNTIIKIKKHQNKDKICETN
jgi:hypothetical protein